MMAIDYKWKVMKSITEIDDTLNDLSKNIKVRKNQGICLIFNHQSFKDVNLLERKGTDLDAHAMEVTFKYIGFETRRYDDLSAKQVNLKLKEVSEEDHSTRNAIIQAA
ncbi:caspase-3-like [Brevipalpus obovatus]|uniref:caspase-3-like n=1 Tax=Brevipalpus obovatus TaxID=246614 RepID=UPI003D9E3304